MKDASDADLVRLCINGQNRAFEVLLDRYQRQVYSVAVRMLRRREDADDVAQTVFLKAYEKLDTFNPKYKFFSWVYRMTVNECINWDKRKRPSDPLPVHMVDTARRPDEHVVQAELNDRVGEALLLLKPEDRALIVLKHFQEFSYDDIGYILDIPAKTVKSRLYTARQRLKDALLVQGLIGHDS